MQAVGARADRRTALLEHKALELANAEVVQAKLVRFVGAGHQLHAHLELDQADATGVVAFWPETEHFHASDRANGQVRYLHLRCVFRPAVHQVLALEGRRPLDRG